MSEKIAIFFDAENISAKYVSSILAEVSSRGTIVIQRAYADWSSSNTKEWKSSVTKYPVSAVQVFRENIKDKRDEKEAIDKKVIMDAVEVAVRNPEIDTICVVASDKGYASLALKLRELGKIVLGIGEKNKARKDSLLVNACNEFLYVEDLENIDDDVLMDVERSDDEIENDLSKFSLLKFLDQVYNSTKKTKDNYVLFSRFSESIKRFRSDFSYKNYGYKSFKQMMEDFPEDYEVVDDGKRPATYMLTRKESFQVGERQGYIKRVIRNYGIIICDDGSEYHYYNGDVNPDCSLHALEKGVRVKFTVTREPRPFAADSRDRNGKAINIRID